jgi:hypothetical protein
LNGNYDVMETKYKEEVIVRKKLHNDIEDMKGKIRVYCRIRPMSETEIKKETKECTSLKDDVTLKLQTKLGIKEFTYDSVFGSNSTQQQIFDETSRLIQSAVDGFNVCVFAYGQTGSGKTFTI